MTTENGELDSAFRDGRPQGKGRAGGCLKERCIFHFLHTGYYTMEKFSNIAGKGKMEC